MRFVTVVLILLTAVVTQSCKITMPSLVELLSNYEPYGEGNPSAYDFNTSVALRLQTGFKDTAVIGDFPDTRHGELMQKIILRAGVPEENILFFKEFLISRDQARYNAGLKMFVSDEWTQLRKATRVVHVPGSSVLSNYEDPARVASANTLFVLAAGNVRDYHMGDRDQYKINHPAWNHPDDPKEDRIRKDLYQNTLDSYNTGKVIAAISAEVRKSGNIQPHNRVVRCGDIKESCFTMIPEQSTSSASARLTTMSFYLSQFYETPEEIVETLNVCAVDIGEPGIDREYGRGMANLLCPRVLKKELEIVSSYVEKGSVAETSQGGELQGFWKADKLQVYIPTALQQTLQISYSGGAVGTVEFTQDKIAADFRIEASVSATFLLPIEAKAEEAVNTRGTYTVTDNLLTLQGVKKPFVYTATKDSLHLIQPYTLNEALALLPDPFGSMVDMTSEDFFTDDPIQIKMSFAKKSKLVGDFNEDMVVDFTDFLLLIAAFGSFEGDLEFRGSIDLEPDGMINFTDFLLFANNFGATGK